MSRAPFILAIATVAALVAAGCVSPAGETDTAAASATDLADWWERAMPSTATMRSDASLIDAASDDAHDHANRAQHAGITTPNFEVLGYDALVTETFGTTLTGMGCGGSVTREDGRKLAIVHSISTEVSFVVADVTDPAAPTMLGEFYLPNAVVWDADISADGNHVLIGAYPPGPVFGRDVTLPVPPAPLSLPTTAPEWAKGHLGFMLFRNACTGKVVEVGPPNYLPGPAIVMAGIQDPENPTFEDYVPQPVIGPHSVGSQMIDGTLYATSSVTNLAHHGSYYTIFEITQNKLVPYTVIRTPGNPSPTNLNGHTDVYLHKHPVTGQTLAYLANWDGMYVYDISLPAPVELAAWYDAGSVHTTYPFPTMIDDKAYLMVGQEVGEPSELPSGWVYILDVTDPARPTEVGRWTLPVKPKWDNGGLMFSPHYVAILNHTLFVSNYHGGLWAVDISDMTQPLAYGIFVPDRDSPMPFGGNNYGPTIEDVIVDQETGLITTWDNAGGVYVLRFDESVDVPRAPAWPTA